MCYPFGRNLRDKRGEIMNIQNKRGKLAEEMVRFILEELSQEKVISGFEDCTKSYPSLDFKVSKLNGEILSLEVKSSSVDLKKHIETHPDIPIIVVYPYWEIHPKFRKFSANETKKNVKKQILSLLL
jgi:hypothetical protein